jgi:hypothetical protein
MAPTHLDLPYEKFQWVGHGWRGRFSPKLPETRRSASVADLRAPTEHTLPAAVVRVRWLGWAPHKSTRGGARTVSPQTIGVVVICEIEDADERGLLAAIFPGRLSGKAQGVDLLNKRSGNWVYFGPSPGSLIPYVYLLGA